MLIEKAWYGLVESSALWYTEIRAFLLALGYTTHRIPVIKVYPRRKLPTVKLLPSACGWMSF